MLRARRIPPRLAGIAIAVVVVTALGAGVAAAGVAPADAATSSTDAGVPGAADGSIPDGPGGVWRTTDPDLVPAYPPLTLESPAPAPAPPPRPLFYRRDWFWGAVGVVVLTTAILLIATTSGGGDQPPPTTLGNMHAF